MIEIEENRNGEIPEFHSRPRIRHGIDGRSGIGSVTKTGILGKKYNCVLFCYFFGQYRIMEGDRKALFEETTNKLTKQRKIIDRLRKERDDLMTDIKVATCHNQKKKDTKATVQLEALLQRYGDVTAEYDKQKIRLDELDQQIKKVPVCGTVIASSSLTVYFQNFTCLGTRLLDYCFC